MHKFWSTAPLTIAVLPLTATLAQDITSEAAICVIIA
jgi:hypothetical protein